MADAEKPEKDEHDDKSKKMANLLVGGDPEEKAASDLELSLATDFSYYISIIVLKNMIHKLPPEQRKSTLNSLLLMWRERVTKTAAGKFGEVDELLNDKDFFVGQIFGGMLKEPVQKARKRLIRQVQKMATEIEAAVMDGLDENGES